MNITKMIKSTRSVLKWSAIGLAAVAVLGMGVGNAQAATTTSVIDLGVQDSGTFLGAGVWMLKIDKANLPVGSFLRSVSANVRVDDGDPYPGDICVFFADDDGNNPVLRVGDAYDGNTPGAPTEVIWDAGWSYNNHETINTTLTAGIPAIDLNSYAVLLYSGWNGTWSGTITLEYDLPALPATILTFGPGAVVGELVANAAEIAWTVPYGTDVTTLSPTFTLSSGACDKDNGGPATYDFTSPVVYTVTDEATVNAYTVTVTVGPDESTVLWNTGSGTWDAVTFNWIGQTSGLPMAFFNGFNVIFSNTVGGTVTIVPGMEPLTTAVSAVSGTYTFGGQSIIASGPLIKSGGGQLSLNVTPANFSSIALQGGTLYLHAAETGFSPNGTPFNMPDTTVESGATLMGERANMMGNLIMNGGTWWDNNGWSGSWTGPVTLNADSFFGRNAWCCNQTINGVISGPGGFTFSTTYGAVLTLNGMSDYTGKTIVQGGTLLNAGAAYLSNAGLPGAFGAPTGPDATIDLYNGVTLQNNGMNPRVNQSTDRPLNLAGTGPGTVSIRYNDNDASLTFGAVTATGTGEKTLALYTGNNGNGDREAIIFTGEISDSSDNSPTSLAITFRTQGSPNWVSLSGTNTFTGPITLTQIEGTANGVLVIGGVIAAQSGANTVGTGTLGNGNYPGAIALGTRTVLMYDSTTAQILSGVISGPGAMQLTGSGQLTLSGTNTYSGTTTVDAGCTLLLTHNSALGADTSVYLPSDAGALDLDFAATDMDQVAKLFVNGVEQPAGLYKAVGNTEAGTELAQITGTGRLLVGIPLIADFTTDPGITGDAPFTVIFTDSSASVLGTITNWVWDFGNGVSANYTSPAGASLTNIYALWGTYPIKLIVSDDAGFTVTNTAVSITVTQPQNLVVSSESQCETVTVNVDPAGSVTFGAGVVNPVFGGLTGSGTFELKNVNGDCISLLVGGDGPDTKFEGALTGCGGLIKIGANTFSLSGTNNTYTGNTIVLNGMLSLSGGGENGIMETIFNSASGDAQNDIEGYRTRTLSLGADDAQGILLGPIDYYDDGSVSSRASALGAVGFNDGDFAMLWIMDFAADTPGVWGFRFNNVDDNTSMWIDTDQNGVFENDNRFFARGCCDSSGDQFTPSLTAGQTYKLGFVMNDTGGGGYFRNLEFLRPGGSWTALDPSDPAQNGMWLVPGAGGGANNVLPTGTTLKIVTPGGLDITGGTHTITRLILDGASQSSGTWGSGDSEADNLSAYFSGTGMLNVTGIAGTLLMIR